MNSPKIKTTGSRRRSLTLLMLSLLAPLATVNADTWSVNIVGAATAINLPSPAGEFIRMMGGVRFDPDAGTAEGGGAATVFNAADHPLGPILRDTWHVTGFVEFEEDEGSNPGHLGGSLTVMIELVRVQGDLVVPAILNIMEDGITVDFLDENGNVTEHYTSATGSAIFHLHGKAEAP